MPALLAVLGGLRDVSTERWPCGEGRGGTRVAELAAPTTAVPPHPDLHTSAIEGA